MEDMDAIVGRLSASGSTRTEADLQSDVRKLLLDAPLSLDPDDLREVALEAQVGGGRRIDVEIGSAAIECKKSLTVAAPKLAEWERQLAGYVRDRTAQLERRYVGVLTDGTRWRLYHLTPQSELALVDELTITGPADAARLVAWLDVVLAVADQIAPLPQVVARRLGASSPGFELDLADLRALYDAVRDEAEVRLKRELWARLLASALGTTFESSDELFVLHTYLVLTAELIAHAAVGLPVDAPGSDVRALLEGQRFTQSDLHGVVEADFFDWPVLAPTGPAVVRGIARRIGRFDWTNVGHDVLKTLYESVIDAPTRQKLGEYYTPDWLAQRMVREVFTDPVWQRLLDPACGSGTFLFWAIREALARYDEQGLDNAAALQLLVQRVHGIDLHPVAVTLARVTYLLAIGAERLRAPDRPSMVIPVFLGDSVRWEQEHTLTTQGGITVYTSDGLELIEQELHFPEAVIEEPERFDRLIDALAGRAAERAPGSKPPAITGILNRHAVGEAERPAITKVFGQLCRLHDMHRDHVWGYYIRNLARPLGFTRPDGRVDVLVGNPPWLAFRHMPRSIQQKYRALAEARGLWAGGKVATHQDLSDLFVARAVEQYLRDDGQFAFVMPFAVLSRGQFAGFRSGDWTSGGGGELHVSFGAPDDFSRVKPPLFPVPAAVVRGRKTISPPGPLATAARHWTGRVISHQLPWSGVEDDLTVADTTITVAGLEAIGSPYRSRFIQGANMVPRMLVTVVERDAGPLGAGAGRRAVASARSPLEKKPWKDLPPLEKVVEAEFIRPMHLGATIVAFRQREPVLAVVPWIDGKLHDRTSERLDEFEGLASWWRPAEELWNRHSAGKMTLLGQIDFQNKLRKQFPIPEHRVAYTKSGQHLAAARITDPVAIIDHKLYWAGCDSIEEARYLTAVLNSGVLAAAVRPLQARGQHNPRDFDLHVFAVPFPAFSADDHEHTTLVALAERAEAVAAAIDFDPSWQFQKARRVTREALAQDGVTEEIDALVALVGISPPLESGTPLG